MDNILIMINDITENVMNSRVSVFADDTRITKVVMCEEDAEELQKDLESFYDWARENNMASNTSKFEVLWFGRNLEIKNSTNRHLKQKN